LTKPSGSLKGLKVGIVGASVAGLATARFLIARGATVTLMERSGSRLEERGGGIALDPDLLDLLGPIRHLPIHSRIVVGSSGNVLWTKALRKCSTAWSEVYRSLYNCVPERLVQRRSAVRGCGPLRSGASVRFEQDAAPPAEFDLVVGADGVGSVVRGVVDPAFRPQYLGYVALRGQIEEETLSPALDRLREWADRSAMVNCYGRRSHVVAYWIPGTKGKSLNWMWYRNVEPSALGEFMSDESGKHHHWSLPPGSVPLPRRRQLADEMAQLFPAPFSLLAAYTSNLSMQAIYGGVPATWVRGAIALVGDAAHVAVPHIGAGSSFAIQDALSLAEALADGRGEATSESCFESRLQSWAADRRERTVRQLEVATRIGRSLQHEDHDFDRWSEQDFEGWWSGMAKGANLYFDR
jgi:2-polyprenyl-6-methoxyphenol hydroxylase-like FAD-dependent oxidoreductase